MNEQLEAELWNISCMFVLTTISLIVVGSDWKDETEVIERLFGLPWLDERRDNLCIKTLTKSHPSTVISGCVRTFWDIYVRSAKRLSSNCQLCCISSLLQQQNGLHHELFQITSLISSFQNSEITLVPPTFIASRDASCPIACKQKCMTDCNRHKNILENTREIAWKLTPFLHSQNHLPFLKLQKTWKFQSIGQRGLTAKPAAVVRSLGSSKFKVHLLLPLYWSWAGDSTFSLMGLWKYTRYRK